MSDKNDNLQSTSDPRIMGDVIPSADARVDLGVTAVFTAGPAKITYTPHEYSPEGRLERMETLFERLLELMVEGESKQDEDTKTASLGVIGFLGTMQPPAGTSYPERLKELLIEYATYRQETRTSHVYHNPYYRGL